jgi:hypothetical protein
MANVRRGFAGFESMVTDLSDLPAPSASPPSPPPLSNQPKTTPPSAEKSIDNSVGGVVLPRPASKSGSPSRWIVAALIVGGIGAALVANNNSNRGVSVTPNYASGSYTPPPTGTGGYTPAPSNVETEEKPPVGEGLALSTAQLRYCLAQGARLDGARIAVDASSEVEINRFNLLVEDYNARCSKFRYYPSAMQAVKSEVEARRTELEAEGAALMVSPYSR